MIAPMGRRVTVGTRPVLIGAPAGRYKLALKNLESAAGADVDLGGPDVASGAGHALLAGETLWIDDYSGPLWAVAAAPREVSVLELFR